MKKYIIFLLILSLFAALAAAQENNTSTDYSKNQQTAIYFDTKNRTGHFVYKEEYYIKDDSGGLKLDKTRKYFDKDINISRIKLMIKRPLDASGMPYDGSLIKAIATLDNKTIMNDWYRDTPKNSNSTKPASNKNLGLGVSVIGILSLFVGVVVLLYLRKRKKK